MGWLSAQNILDDWVGDDLPACTTDTITRWIGKAERLVKREFPTLQERLDSGKEPDLEATVQDVISAMVMRVLRNPDGRRTTSKNAGPYSESITFGGDTPGTLFLTDDERHALALPGGARAGGAYSISMNAHSDSEWVHRDWCSLLLGGAGCSCGALIAGLPIYEAG